MTNEELAEALRGMGRGLQVAPAMAAAMGNTPSSVAIATVAAPIAGALMELGATIAESGHDAADVIRRITDTKPWLDATEKEWESRIAAKPTPKDE